MIQVTVGGQQVTVADVLPSGLIRAFGGVIVPAGWLLCDGSSVSRTQYASLFAAIQTAYGYGDGVTTFNLPDLRGRFARGVDGTAGVDPDKLTRTAIKIGGSTGNAVGSYQSCASKLPVTAFTASGTTGTDSPDHSHSGSAASGGGGAGNPNEYGSLNTQTGNTTGGASNRHSHPISLAVSGGDPETRPTNVYVSYIIKI